MRSNTKESGVVVGNRGISRECFFSAQNTEQAKSRLPKSELETATGSVCHWLGYGAKIAWSPTPPKLLHYVHRIFSVDTGYAGKEHCFVSTCNSSVIFENNTVSRSS